MGTSLSSPPPQTRGGALSQQLQGRRAVGGAATPAVVRRRPGWVWGGASLVVVSAVGFAALVAAAGERESVLAVARDLPVGHVIGPGDLREVSVAADAGVVPAGRAGSVIGKATAVPLTAGALLAPGQVGGDAAFPPKGHSEVSFAVKVGDAPALAPGQRVAVFSGPASSAASGGEDGGAQPVVGTVTGVEQQKASGTPLVVTLLIESAGADRAAALEHPRVVLLASRAGDER